MRLLACSVITLLLTATAAPAPQRSRAITITPSNVVSDVVDRKQRQPNLTASELAQYGNQLTKERGFDYDFDVCDAVARHNRTRANSWKVRNQLSLSNGRPYQTVPIGISADGSKLYLNFYAQPISIDDLVLELSPDGRAAFRARADVGLQDEGESIESPAGEDRSFRRFKAGNQTYLVRFAPPCT